MATTNNGQPPRPPHPAAPPGWPATRDPLSIAILGWARLAYQANQGSGYNLSASELAAGLAMSGHRVHYLASGRRYSILPGPRVSRTETWRGVHCYDLVNSPNLSPEFFNFRQMPREMRCPAQSRLVLRWLDSVAAQVVHIHSMEGYPLDLIGAIRDSGRPVIVTLHNYAFICPQVDLMHEETRICLDYRGGQRCVGCLEPPSALQTRWYRAIGQTFENIVGQRLSTVARQALAGTIDRARELAARRPAKLPNNRPPDPEVARGFDPGPGEGVIRHHFDLDDDNLKPVEPSPIDQNERFLDPARREIHLKVVNEYGRRRIAGVEALNRASLVTPPSDFVRRAHVALGVDESRARVVRLGQPHFDQINRRARRSPFYGQRPWNPAAATRPLRFGFFGTLRPSKGIDVLARAIPMLAREVRQRCQFQVRVAGVDLEYRRRLSLYPEVSFLGGYDLVQLIAAGGDYDVGLLPHAWFENSPLVMLEHLHAGKFVIASRLGGAPEWLIPPKNSLLHPGGDAPALAACITQVVRGEVAIPSPRQIHDATPNLQSYPGHVAEVESTYREVLAPPPAPDPLITHITEPAPARPASAV